MKRICIPLAPGFEEIEAITLVDVLRRAGITALTAGLVAGCVEGAHGVSVCADMPIEQALGEAWDMVVLPGGMPGSTHLRDDARVGTLLERTVRAGGMIGAICAAPIVLAHHGMLDGVKATSYPGFAAQMPRADYREDRVVKDGAVMTSRGPGTAMEFALEIVAACAGAPKAAELRAQMLVP